MRKLKVMLGTNDGEKIFLGHPGDSDVFHIYELREDGSYEKIREIVNEARDMEEKQHGDTRKMKKVLEMVGDIDVILTRRNSPNLIRMAQSTTIQPVIVTVDPIEEGLKKLHERFDEIYELVERRRKGERFEVKKI